MENHLSRPGDFRRYVAKELMGGRDPLNNCRNVMIADIVQMNTRPIKMREL